MLDRPEEYAQMAAVEQSHWWYKTLHQKVLQAFSQAGLKDDSPILDAGCGTGGFLEALGRAGYRSLEGFDFSEEAVRICRSKGLKVGQLSLLEAKDRYPRGRFAGICCQDVLYFLEPQDWKKATQGLAELLVPGGLLVLNLPALAAFGGSHDLCVGIKRRFSKADLPQIFDPAGLELVRSDYWPFALSPVIFLVRWLQRRALAKNPDLPVQSDLHLPTWWVNLPLWWLNRLEQTLGLPAPWGSSLFLVFRKKAD